MPTRVISDSASELVPKNLLRKSFLVQNQDASINIFIKAQSVATDVSTTDHDFRLAPGDTFTLVTGEDGNEQITARYTIIAASGTPRIAIFETENVRR